MDDTRPPGTAGQCLIDDMNRQSRQKRHEGGVRLSEASARDFFELLKPRVMSLVVFTASSAW
jgi:heme O synthase-like polyprenyltransferase